MKKQIFIIIPLFLIFIILIFALSKKPNSSVQQNSSVKNNSQNQKSNQKDNFMASLLDGYPESQIPLYKLDSVESIKYFVNDDPQNLNDFFPANKNYYNLVYKTKAEPSDFLNYYEALMSYVSQEDKNESQVAGNVDKYKVLASHYGHDNNAYLQIYLPNEEFTQENKYYADYPNLVEPDESWLEHESSYGKMSQQGGIIEYTQYWTVNREEVEDFEKTYAERYQNKTDFKNDNQGSLGWTEKGYQINLTFSKDHGRVYLMMRKPK